MSHVRDHRLQTRGDTVPIPTTAPPNAPAWWQAAIPPAPATMSEHIVLWGVKGSPDGTQASPGPLTQLTFLCGGEFGNRP
jgi:hypothetical protein